MPPAEKNSFAHYTDSVSKHLSLKPYYSWFVKFNRILLPLIALGIVVSLVVWPMMNENPVFRRKPVQHAQQSAAKNTPDPIIDNQPIAMENPEFSGIDRQGRPFTITAKKVLQKESAMTSDMTLIKPVADIFLKDQTWLALHAQTGVYMQEKQNLDLQGNVTLFHDEGYSLKADAMFVDLQAGYAETNTPVHIQGPAGIIDASAGMQLFNFDEKIIFHGPAKLTLHGDLQ